MGFDKRTPISIYYNELPNILATLINGLVDANVGNRIETLLENTHYGIISCSQLFEWWSDSLVGLDPDEYRILKNFTCDLDPENFNAYTDLYMSETDVWRKPINKYQSYMFTVIGDIYDFVTEASKFLKNVEGKNVTIDVPFSTDYWLNVLRRLRNALELRKAEEETHKVNRSFHGMSSLSYDRR